MGKDTRISNNLVDGQIALTESRLLTANEAAAYLNISTATLRLWHEKGLIQGPFAGTRRWDKRALDAALDKDSGLAAQSPPTSEFDNWKAMKLARSS